MKLTLREEWMEPGYTPDNLYEAPFQEMFCSPPFHDVLQARDAKTYRGSLEAFASELLEAVDAQIAKLEPPVHLLLSGGYDSRILAFLLEKHNKEPLYVTDGMEEPSCTQIMDLLDVPEERRYLHPMDGFDPYGITGAVCEGFAPLYQQMRFMPGDPQATLVTGLGGGEWFSYPASGWLNGKQRRLPGDDVVAMWMDCWPQYTLLPDAWARGYKDAVHPYCTLAYARVAARCRPEWLQEVNGNPALDIVRASMLSSLDYEHLLAPKWMPHVYPWNLSDEQKDHIDARFFGLWVAEYWRDEFGRPSQLDEAPHACTLAGFATWVDLLTAEGVGIVRA